MPSLQVAPASWRSPWRANRPSVRAQRSLDTKRPLVAPLAAMYSVNILLQTMLPLTTGASRYVLLKSPGHNARRFDGKPYLRPLRVTDPRRHATRDKVLQASLQGQSPPQDTTGPTFDGRRAPEPRRSRLADRRCGAVVPRGERLPAQQQASLLVLREWQDARARSHRGMATLQSRRGAREACAACLAAARRARLGACGQIRDANRDRADTYRLGSPQAATQRAACDRRARVREAG
jgi:hypothetical protein